jgi:hypothetical protein
VKDFLDLLTAAGLIGAVLGLAIAASPFIALIVMVRGPYMRLRALGFVYVGLSVVAASCAVLMISRVGDRLPLVAGLPPIVLLLVVAAALGVAASRSFKGSTAARPPAA